MDSNKDFFIYLRHHAESTPDKIAFREPDGASVSYCELYERVCALASSLKSYFAEKDDSDDAPVAVYVDRSISSIWACLGVMAAGKWYVPIDGQVPSERFSQLLSICNPSLVLLPAAGNIDISYPHLFCDSVPTCDTSDFEYEKRDKKSPMFGIFTSGSTGTPKLVVKNMLGIFDFIEEYCRTFSFSEDEVFCNQIPFYFDASTKDIFSTIYLGATSVIFPQKLFSLPMFLIQKFNDEHISSFVCVPSVMGIAAQFDVFSVAVPKYLKNVLFVGERMPVKNLNYWRKALPETRFVNLYGSTEVAGNSCYYIVDREFNDNETLPIGHAFATSEVFLINDRGIPSSEGEICVGGNGLALGYYRDIEKTNSVFTETSFANPPFTGRLYHSGDHGLVNSFGEFVCIARKDAQIKHMGHRIELGEIEACASSLPYIGECCCLYSKEEEKIVLFFSLVKDISDTLVEEKRRALRKDLSKLLPKYMIPHSFIFLQELPHNRNGKTDRAALLQSLKNDKEQ